MNRSDPRWIEAAQAVIDTADNICGDSEDILAHVVSSMSKFSIPQYYEEGLRRLLYLIVCLRYNRLILTGVEGTLIDEESNVQRQEDRVIGDGELICSVRDLRFES